MREIKFRAWDKHDKKMYIFNQLIPVLNTFNNKYGIASNNLYFADCRYDEDIINDFELMQFTGLKDKNGKEIYEGDIMSWIPLVRNYAQEKLFRIVKWNIERCCFEGYTEGEVVGNIYENPELIK